MCIPPVQGENVTHYKKTPFVYLISDEVIKQMINPSTCVNLYDYRVIDITRLG